MANNRLFLKCNICGETYMIAKSMGDGFYTSRFDVQAFNKFLEKHTFCCTEDKYGNEGDYSLEYETSPEEEKKIRKEIKQYMKDKRMSDFVNVEDYKKMIESMNDQNA